MSATATPKLSLHKPTASTNEPFRISDYNANMDKIDAGGNGAFVCTAGSRPGAPYEGMHIWESDTEANGYWDSEGWLIYDSKWQTYTPVWTADTGTTGVGGAGSLTGKYFRMGKMCHFVMQMQLATGYSGGTGVWHFSLPFPGVNPGTLNQSGSALAIKASLFYVAVVHVESSGTVFQMPYHGGASTGGNGVVGHSQPGGSVWGANEAIRAQGIYEML